MAEQQQMARQMGENASPEDLAAATQHFQSMTTAQREQAAEPTMSAVMQHFQSAVHAALPEHETSPVIAMMDILSPEDPQRVIGNPMGHNVDMSASMGDSMRDMPSMSASMAESVASARDGGMSDERVHEILKSIQDAEQASCPSGTVNQMGNNVRYN